METGGWVENWNDVKNAYNYWFAVYGFAGLDWYVHYTQTGNPSDHQQAMRLFTIAFFFQQGATAIAEGWQRDWSYNVVGNDYWGATGDLAGADDGFIPNSSQAPPFFNGRHLRAEGTNHSEETRNEETLDWIEFALDQFGVEGTSGSPPPPPPPPGGGGTDPCPDRRPGDSPRTPAPCDPPGPVDPP